MMSFFRLATGPTLAFLLVVAVAIASVSGSPLPFQIFGSAEVGSSELYLDIAADLVNPAYWILASDGLFRVLLNHAVFQVASILPFSDLFLHFLAAQS